MKTVHNQSDTFGLGNLAVHRLGYGAMRLTGEGVWGPPKDRAGAKKVLHRALDLGVDFIDTADAYGPDVNEELIAEALYPYPEGLVIATKGGLTRSGPNEWHPNGRPDHLRKALEGSLKRLKVNTVDLYQFHRPDPDVPFEDSVGTLHEMQKEGKVKHVGLSNVSVEQLDTARNLLEIVSVQNRYNLTDRASEAVLQACEKYGIGFIPWYPIATGDLPADDLEKITSAHDATPAQVALAWLLHKSPVMLPIPGTSSLAHLEENVAASALQLSDEEMRMLSDMN